MKICILTLKYPTVTEPTALTFVQQLAWQFADEGQDVEVICPLPVSKLKEYKDIPVLTIERTYEGKTVNVYHPRSIYLGQVWIGKWNTAYVSTLLFRNAVNRVLKNMKIKPDVLYGHFVTPAGITACLLGKKYDIPAYIAYGESTPWTIDQIGRKKAKILLSNVEPDKVKVFPNGYMPSRFSVKNKNESREHFGLPTDKFIVGFVGHFIERKGIKVLKQAVDQIPDVYLICAGKGDLKPVGQNVLFADLVKPEDLAYFYSAADCFVLPTTNEGCCNAIIEAMACGLPIVSSNCSFNDDILNNDNSIRVDSLSVDEVRDAIIRLKENVALREKMSKSSLELAEGLTLQQRARNIIKILN